MSSCRARLSTAIVALATAALLAVSPLAATGDFPSRTLRVIVPSAPGGLADILPRILGDDITKQTGQPVVVENKPGGYGFAAGLEALKSPADGYTILMASHGMNAMLPHMSNKLPFEPSRAFVPIVHILTVPSLLVVHPKVPARSVAELIAYAKANPGKLSYASQGIGSSGHVAGELFKQLVDVDIRHVPYRGAAQAAQDVLGGEAAMMFDTVTLAAPRVAAGRLRALGVASHGRTAVLGDVPTLADQGVPLKISAWFGLMAPADAPRHAVEWLNAQANRTFAQPAHRDRFTKQGALMPLGSPAAFAAHIEAEHRKWGLVIKQAKIRID